MAQHDYNIINGSGQNVRDDINGAFQAAVSNNAGALPPEVKYEGTLWFDTSDTSKPGALKVYDATGNWKALSSGPEYLSLTGGNIIGDLTVTGTFSNPDFTKARASYMGAAAPASPAAGMQWYDISVPATPVLRTRNAGNSAWVEAAPSTDPVFQTNLNVVSTGNAQVLFTASGETRRIVNDATNNWLAWLKPDGNLNLVVRDTGDVWIAGFGDIGAALNAKQAALGYTPLWQAGSNVTYIGQSPARIYVDPAGDYGPIRLGSSSPVFTRGQVGSYSKCTTIDPTVQGNGTIAGGNLRYGNDSGPNNTDGGTWRNMGGGILDAQNSTFQRIA